MEDTKPQILLWAQSGFAYRVTIPAEILDAVRISVVEAFYSVPRGGVEIGGVFFGFFDGDTLRIAAIRPIKCEYATGPSFHLSTKDQIAMSGVVCLPEYDLELKGMIPLGWFHSHTRSEIFLSPADLQLYNEFFPEKWQFAMVLRPGNLQATRAAFFVRQAKGYIPAEAPDHVYILEPPAYGMTLLDEVAPEASAVTEAPAISDAPAIPVGPAIEASPPPRQVQEPPAPPEAFAAVASSPISVTVPAPAPPQPLPTPPEQQPVDALQKLIPDPVRAFPPLTFGRSLEPPPRTYNWLWALAMLLVLGAAATAAMLYWPKPGRLPSLGLETYDVNGALLIRWDRDSTVIKQATRAALEIRDGALSQPVELTAEELSRGGYGYTRLSGKVDVHMKVVGPQSMEEDSSFVGALPHPPETASSADTATPPDEAAATAARLTKALDENRQMKTELLNESMGMQELQQTIDRLNRQLVEERAHRSAPKQ